MPQGVVKKRFHCRAGWQCPRRHSTVLVAASLTDHRKAVWQSSTQCFWDQVNLASRTDFDTSQL